MAIGSISSGFGNKKEGGKTLPHNPAPVENIICSADNRAQIVLGGDRTSDVTSGYSGLGANDSAAIDIVVGRAKTISKEKKEKAISANPDFFSDAARIYISEKANIDNYFSIISSEKSGIEKSIASSAIALKADAIRIIGVEGVKIVTRANPSNSKGKESGVQGIELVAGNDDTYLQPMVKGNNLAKCIEQIVINMSNLESQIDNIYNFLDQFISNYSIHIHQSTTPGSPTVVSPSGISISAISNIAGTIHNMEKQEFSDNLIKIRNDFLVMQDPDKNILSPYNKTN